MIQNVGELCGRVPAGANIRVQRRGMDWCTDTQGNMYVVNETTDEFVAYCITRPLAASDSIYTVAAGLPSYGISGVAIDQDDIRAHGKDERVRVASYYGGVDFFYRYLKALTQ